MHYDVGREKLRQLPSQIEELALIERKTCRPEEAGCKSSERRCHTQKGGPHCEDVISKHLAGRLKSSKNICTEYQHNDLCQLTNHSSSWGSTWAITCKFLLNLFLIASSMS